MAIVTSAEELKRYMRDAVHASPDKPVLVDRYLNGLEVRSTRSVTALTS